MQKPLEVVGLEGCIHRFYDTSPISPSGRFIAVTKLPYDDRPVSHGDYARVIVVELETNKQIYSKDTAAWDAQVGAHVQWGASDDELFFNVVDTNTWEIKSLKVDVSTGKDVEMEGAVYNVAADGSFSAAPDLSKIIHTQRGYGVLIPNHKLTVNHGWVEDDGLYKLDLKTGKNQLILSFKEIFDHFPSVFKELTKDRGGAYGFHAKVSPDCNRVMFIVRWQIPGGSQKNTKNFIITCDPDGTNLNLSLHHDDWIGGHHPNWMPDSHNIIMNLIFPSPRGAVFKFLNLAQKCLKKANFKIRFKACELSLVKFDQAGLSKVKASKHIGSGHPSASPDGRYILTDAYLSEPMSRPDGYAPLRMIDTDNDTENTICWVYTRPFYLGSNNEFRVDPHPAWSRCGKFISYNSFENNERSVKVISVEGVVIK
jgi:hypothetical protein